MDELTPICQMKDFLLGGSTTCMQASLEPVMKYGDVVSLGGKYVFVTVMCLVLHMCILIICSTVLCVC